MRKDEVLSQKELVKVYVEELNKGITPKEAWEVVARLIVFKNFMVFFMGGALLNSILLCLGVYHTFTEIQGFLCLGLTFFPGFILYCLAGSYLMEKNLNKRLALLPEIKAIEDRNDLRAKLKQEYATSPLEFITKYFQSYSEEVDMLIKFEIGKGGEDYLMNLINTESDKYKEIKAKLSPKLSLKV